MIKLLCFKKPSTKTINNKAVIYKITNIKNNKFYIGSAKNFHRRLYRHLKDLKNNKHKNVLLQNAFNILDKNPNHFTVEILEEVKDASQLISTEQKWLDQYFDNQKLCYNICQTASSWFGNKHTQESKRKISDSNPNKKPVEQWSVDGNYIGTFSSMTEAAKQTGVTVTEIFAAAKKENALCKGFQWKIKNSSKNIKIYTDNSCNKKIVHQFDLNGNRIKQYSSLGEASNENNIDSSSICACCKNKAKSAGGYLWSYENSKNKQSYKNNAVKKVHKLDPNTQEIINTYNSIKEAAKEHNIPANGIGYVCSGKQKTAAGFKWKYV